MEFIQHNMYSWKQRVWNKRQYYYLYQKSMKWLLLLCHIVFATENGTYLSILDSDSKRIRQKFYTFFINEMFKKMLHFLICILPSYVPHEITKEFWKNSHFEKITAGFLLRCQNRLRWNTPEKMHFQERIFLFSPILPL